MPTCKNRSQMVAPSAQIRKATSGNKDTLQGKQSYDGRLNTGAGTQHSPVPSTLEGKAVVVRTNG